MTIRKELIDELPATSDVPLIGPDGQRNELTGALVERMPAGELNQHPGYEKHDVAGYKIDAGSAPKMTAKAGDGVE